LKNIKLISIIHIVLIIGSCQETKSQNYNTIIYSETAPKNMSITFESKEDAIDLLISQGQDNTYIKQELKKITTNKLLGELTNSFIIEPQQQNKVYKFNNFLKIKLKLNKKVQEDKLALFYIKKIENGKLIGLMPLKSQLSDNNEIIIETKRLGLFKLIHLKSPIFNKIEQLQKN